MSNALVGDASVLAGVLQDQLRQLRDGSLSLEALSGFVAHRHIRRFALGETQDNAFKDLREKWEDDYACDLSDALIPEHQEGLDWLLIVRKDLWPNEAYERLGRLKIPTYRYMDDLNSIMSVREPLERSYGVWLRKGQEADADFRNKSFNDLWRKVNGITVTERLVAERDWFKETNGGHLDEKSWTLCTGSRYSDGNVSAVRWYDDKVNVHWRDHVHADPGIGARQAVS